MSDNIPPPEQRLCKKHGKPIMPNQWRSRHYITGCAKCVTERIRSPKARKRRKEKWEKNFISCARHPERRCNKSRYIRDGVRRCGSCSVAKSDGTKRPAYQRHMDKNNPLMRESRKRCDEKRKWYQDPLKQIRKAMNQHSVRLQGALNGISN
jgi:hypothetical protein